MPTWALAGQTTGLTRDIEDIVIDYIKNNWTQTEPPVIDIIWTDDWYDQNGDFCIAVNDTQLLPGRKSIGFGSTREYKAYVDVHFFVRVLGEDQSFPYLGNMEREVDRILNTVRIETIQPGLVIADFTEAKQDPQPEGAPVSIWKSHITLEIKYWMGTLP